MEKTTVMMIDNHYNIGEIVYIKADEDQKSRMITGILVTPNGFTYRLENGQDCSYHYEMEITAEKSFLTVESEKKVQ
jgi:hypothetical protein